jgi:hypothetical protein
MTRLFLLSLFLLEIACNSSNPPSTEQPKSEDGGITFKFDSRQFPGAVRDPGNWCFIPKGDAALINADAQNYSRRFFALGTVPCQVIVERGNMSASFILQQIGNEVMLLTAQNLPTCLSATANFQISSKGSSFTYDNKRDLSFQVFLNVLPGGTQIVVELPANSGLGLTAIRCDDCK